MPTIKLMLPSLSNERLWPVQASFVRSYSPVVSLGQ